MIILLPQSVEELSVYDKGKIEDLFCRLIEADRMGRHFFILPRDSVRWALKELQFSSKHKNHLISIGENYSIRGGLPKVARTWLSICLTNQVVSLNDDGSFSIGIDAFLGGVYSEEVAALVLEDLVNDAGLYGHIFNEARKFTKVPSYKYVPVHAGGSRILPVFKAEVARQKVVCCIFDTDQKSPMSRRSTTACDIALFYRRCNLEPYDNNVPFVGKIFPSTGHELENAIPYSIAKTLIQIDQDSLSVLDGSIDQDTPKAEDDCFWLYFDLKNGINGRSMLAKEKNGDLSSQAVDWICEKLSVTREDLSGLEVAGFGNNIAQIFLSVPDALRAFHDFCRTDYWKQIFLPKFEEALWYFAAPIRERI